MSLITLDPELDTVPGEKKDVLPPNPVRARIVECQDRRQTPNVQETGRGTYPSELLVLVDGKVERTGPFPPPVAPVEGRCKVGSLYLHEFVPNVVRPIDSRLGNLMSVRARLLFIYLSSVDVG